VDLEEMVVGIEEEVVGTREDEVECIKGHGSVSGWVYDD